MSETSTVRPPSESPLESFIADFLVPNRDRRNTWVRPLLDTRELLLEDARRRRRLTPKKVTTGYKLFRGAKTIGGLDAGMTTLVSHQALKASRRPRAMRQYLAASDIPTIPTETFHVSQFSAAEKSLPADGSQVIVRPASPRARSVDTATIVQGNDFLRAWEAAVGASLQLKPLERFVEIQKYRPALNIRAYVVGENVVAALVRAPIHIVGNGTSSVGELLEQELAEWDLCHYLGPGRPNATSILHKTQLSRDYVIPPKQVAVLSRSPDYKPGEGLTIDVTDYLNDELANLAVNTMWAFPGLAATAVDLLASSLDHAVDASAVGIDPSAELSEFVYPTFGSSRRVSLRILDHMIRTSR